MTVETGLCTGVSGSSEVEIEETIEENLSSLEDEEKADEDCNEIVCDTDEKSDGEVKDTGESSYVFITKESDSSPERDATMQDLIGNFGDKILNLKEDYMDNGGGLETEGEVIKNQESEMMVLENCESEKAEDSAFVQEALELEINACPVNTTDCCSELTEGETNQDGDGYVFIDVVSNEPAEREHTIEDNSFSDFPQMVIVGSVICGIHQITTSGSPESPPCSSDNAKLETGVESSSSDSRACISSHHDMNDLRELDTIESASPVEEVHLESEVGSSPSLRNTESTFSSSSHNLDEKMEKRPIFRYLIKVPRYFDETLGQQIDSAQLQVDEATRLRDAVRAKVVTKKASCNDYRNIYEASKSETKAAYDVLYLKRQEIDSVQLNLNRINNAISIDEIDNRMHNIQHWMEHETISLKEEKQLLHEIKQLKRHRQQLYSSLDKQAEGELTFDRKEELEGHLKFLKRELDSARKEVLRTEGITNSARKIYFDENEKLRDLKSQIESANALRQEAYEHGLKLKKQLYDKNKYFRIYKDDARKAEEYGCSGDREALHSHCVNQVEKIMEIWNNNDDFRNNYIRCNTESTLRRLGTLDGRSLGPGDDPRLLQKIGDGKLIVSPAASTEMNNLLSSVPTFEQGKPVLPLGPENAEEKSSVRQKQKNQTAQSNEAIPSVLSNTSATVYDEMEVEKKIATENEQVQGIEELARKEEVLRKEVAAAKIREQRLLEERAKAKEAEERKRRNAEKARARAELKAQKEAEDKEKERAKREMRKARKKTLSGISEQESSSARSESTLPVSTVTRKLEIEIKPKITATRTSRTETGENQTKTASKRSSSLLAKQAKAVPPPPPPSLLNKNRKRMQTWMSYLLMATVVGFAALIFWIFISDLLDRVYIG